MCRASGLCIAASISARTIVSRTGCPDGQELVDGMCQPVCDKTAGLIRQEDGTCGESIDLLALVASTCLHVVVVPASHASSQRNDTIRVVLECGDGQRALQQLTTLPLMGYRNALQMFLFKLTGTACLVSGGLLHVAIEWS